LFLLDGLDEVSELSQREQVTRWIEEALRLYPDCRFVVTCRFAGYSPTVHFKEHFLEMHLRPLTGEQVEMFVRNWYRIIEKGLARDIEQAEEIAAEKADHLIDRLKQPDFRARRVSEMTRNPLLLTNICLVHRHRGSLPQKRARLYEECIDVLLEHWRVAKNLNIGVSAQEGRRALQPAALWLHQQEGRTRATAEKLAPHIAPVLKNVKWEKGTAEDFLRTIRDESGLLTGWDQENYGFMHLGFQEYLAAREIRTRAFKESSVLKELAKHFGESWWQEVGLLLLALDDPSLFEPYIQEVVKQPTFAEHSSLVDLCLDDAAETSPLPFVELLQTPPAKNKGLWKRQLAALRVLERLAPESILELKTKLVRHPYPSIRQRFKEMTFKATEDVLINEIDGYELVRIPGGTFLMGSPKDEEGRFDDEGPQHQVQVPEFYMGHYQVTNEQYGKFLADNPKVAEPEFWSDRQFNQPRQPVVGVDWKEAQMYAQWAGLRLPAEAEWEYACRAGTTSRYHGGDSEKDLDRVGWYSDNSGMKLHPVGEKEANAFGLHDMHGNIDEWLEDNWHDNYEGAPDDGQAWIDDPLSAQRVVRGGSWILDAPLCRSAVRRSFGPSSRYRYLGFRLSRSLALGP
jgi:formylglycine-generating enzyme required for sulfatase activity